MSIRHLSIQYKIVAPFLSVVIIGFALLVTIVTYFQFQAEERNAGRVLATEAARESLQTTRAIETALITTRANAEWISRALAEDRFNRGEINQTLRAVLEANPEITGIYLGLEPNADGNDSAHTTDGLGDKDGRLLVYNFRSSGQVVTEPTPLTGDPAEKDWYYRPLAENREAITPPYPYEVDKQTVLMTTVVAPISVKGKAVGIITADLSLKHLQGQLGALKPMETGFASLISSDGQWVAHPDTARLGKPAEDNWAKALLQKVTDGKAASTEYLDPATSRRMHAVMVPVKFGHAPEAWGFAISVPHETVVAQAQRTRDMLLVSALLILVLVSVIGYFVGRSVTRPIKTMTSTMEHLATGDLSVDVVDTERGDEIGKMANAILVFKNNAQKIVAMEREQAATREEHEKARRKEMNDMVNAFESAVLTLVEGVSKQSVDMKKMAQSIATDAQNAAGQSTAVSAAAQQATTNVQVVASTTDELSSSISEISRQVDEAAKISALAFDETTVINTKVGKLSASVEKIGQVVDLINDIAAQTNLLALNATIEAARAGEAGKGFAVVANEVKSLATQTARATEEITGQIVPVQDETKQTVEAIVNISNVIEQVRHISSGIASAVEEQGAATQEIARSVQEAAKGTQEVSHNINGVSNVATNFVRDSSEILDLSGKLARNAEKMHEEVVYFIEKVRNNKQ